MKKLKYVPIAAFLFAACLSCICAGATITVGTGAGYNFTSIQSAIDHADNGDEIVVAPGTYNEAINFSNKAVRLRSSGGAAVTTIDGTGHYHVVRCVSGEGPGTILEGFTITGGNANSCQDPDCTESEVFFGGGMVNIGSSPTVLNCIFSGNSAFESGGGMYNEASSPTVTDCIFDGNSAVWSVGGGMYNTQGSSPTVSGCTFIGNSAYNHGGGMSNKNSSPTVSGCTFIDNSAGSCGGGMNNETSSLTVTHCTFSGNSAGQGGGMYNATSNLTVSHCTFSGNSAGNTGGGMYNWDSSSTLSYCVFNGNSAQNYWGGGISNNQNSSSSITNSIFSGNTATYGGAMSHTSSSPPVINCTFFGNTATSGGAMVTVGTSSTPTLTNCIVWGSGLNSISGVPGYWVGSPVVSYSNIEGGYAGTGNIDAYPFFADAAGGDFRLMQYSTCIDAGNNAAVPVDITTDLAGNPRIADGSGDGTSRVDMGAYEFESDHVRVGLGTLSVVVTPDAAVLAGAMWRVEGAEEWLLSGASVDLTPGYYTLEFLDLAEWFEPHIVRIGYNENDPNRIAVRSLRVRVIGDMTAAAGAAYVPLPVYAIGQIPSIQAPHGGVLEFLVEAPWLDSEVEFSVTPLYPEPSGPMSIDPVSGHFTYEPHDNDRSAFEVVFWADSISDANDQTIQIAPLLDLPPEYAIVSGPVQAMPDTDRQFVSEMLSDGPEYLNGSQFDNVRSVTVAGIEITIEDVPGNTVYGFHTSRDIKDLTIYAETLIIRAPLHLPQTEVTIHAQQVIFEDSGGILTHISTTPIDWRPGGQRPDSLAGGNIALFIETYEDTKGLSGRFVLHGTPSDHAMGQAGVLTCTLDAAKPLSWFSPFALKRVIAHARDAYLYGHTVATRQMLEEYNDLLGVYIARPEWQTLPAPWQFEFEQMYQELIMLVHRLDSDLDYFGNPPDWVPALSFEVLKAVYEKEIDHAIRAWYLAYWLEEVADTAQHKADGLKSTRTQLWKETEEFRNQYNSYKSLLGPLRTRSAEITARIGSGDNASSGLLRELKFKEERLLENARNNVQLTLIPSDWEGFTKMLSIVTTHTVTGASVGGKAGAFVGYFGGLLHASEVVPSGPFLDPWENTKNVTDVTRTYAGLDFNEAVNAWGLTFNDVNLTALEADGAAAYLQNLRTDAHRMAGGLRDIKESLWTTRLDDKEVDEELKRIKALDPAFGRLVDEIVALTVEKQAINRQLADALQQITMLANAMTNNVLAIDALNREVGELNRNYDPRVVMYVGDMKQRALARLKKYHYYMAKAYEYRLLKPYSGDLNIDTMFTSMMEMVSHSSDGTLSAADFDALKGLYQEHLSTLAETILDEFMAGHQENTIAASYYLSEEEIDLLNAGKPLTLNLFERGLFPSNEENIRIIDMRVDSIGVSVTGSCGGFGTVIVTMRHPSVSKLQRGDNVYVFRHLAQAKNSTSPLTIQWESRYNTFNSQLSHVEVSASSDSLLRSLISVPDMALLYSRPGAWADIIITKSDHKDMDCRMDITAMSVIVDYDYYAKDPDLQTLRVTTEPKMLNPGFRLSTADESGRRDGTGNIYRIYDWWETTGVSVTAPTKVGYWRFVRWTDRFGNTLGTQPTRTVSFLPRTQRRDQTIKAHYEYEGPLLSIGDFTEDYWVDYYDFEAMSRVWMTTPAHPDWDARFDISDSGSVGLEDLLIFLDDWLATD